MNVVGTRGQRDRSAALRHDCFQSLEQNLPAQRGVGQRGDRRNKGFPRRDAAAAREAAQLAIFSVQRQLEAVEEIEEPAAIALCDRGTLDSFAYWPGDPSHFWREVGSTREHELSRYDAVIHMRTPGARGGYDQRNPLRIESAAEAAAIDARIEQAWEGHPRRWFVETSPDFLAKVRRTLDLIREQLPPCCRLPQPS